MASKVTRQNIGIKMHGEADGYIEYSDTQKSPEVSFNVVLNNRPVGRRAVIRYLTTKREFFIPFRSDITDQYREETHVPTVNIDIFEQALNELGSAVGIFLIE
jgi:hypothetical protein